MKVLTLQDTDGHMHVFDVSTKESETRIYQSILKELLATGYLDEEATQTANQYLAQVFVNEEEIVSFFDDFTQISANARGSLHIVHVEGTWPIKRKLLSQGFY